MVVVIVNNDDYFLFIKKQYVQYNVSTIKMAKLIIDTRERKVSEHKTDLTCDYKIQQISVGDYHIVHEYTNSQGQTVNKILAVIERKTYADYAASIKDGRSDNKSKMIELREDTNCRIIYIIEGSAFPDPKDYVGGISFKNIESSIFHLMLRDNIMIMYTKDTIGTAKTLVRLIDSTNTLLNKGFAGGTPEVQVVAPEYTPEQLSARLTAPYTKTDHDIRREIWACFSGITIEQADEYIARFDFKKLISKEYTPSDIIAIKLSNGKPAGKRQQRGMMLFSLADEIRMLTKIPKVSAKTAAELLLRRHLCTLLNMTVDQLAAMTIGAKKKPLGIAVATKILTVFLGDDNVNVVIIPTPNENTPVKIFTD